MKRPNVVFFGGEPLGVPALDALYNTGIIPNVVITNPDRPQGRRMVLTPPPTKVRAIGYGIPVFQPDSYNASTTREWFETTSWDLFVVVAYNFILPKWLLELPKYGTLNVHPSLLPKLRGASPIRSAILQDMRETGVTIIQLDEKMDHGPILVQEVEPISESEWPLRGRELDRRLATRGGDLLARSIPEWLRGDIVPQEQNHEAATYCTRFEKADGELSLDPQNLPSGQEAYRTLLKIYAYDGWPGTFFTHEGKRIKVNDAKLAASGELCIIRVTPEGKHEMDFTSFLQSN